MRAKTLPLTELAGEDRTFGGNRLYVDLVPSTSWMKNVRTTVSGRDWNRIKDLSRLRTNSTCELCSARPNRLDAHERWSYQSHQEADTTIYIQKLERIVCLCQPCHLATHFGYAQISGKDMIAEQHLQTVNHWSRDETESHIAEALRVWEERNTHVWTLDLSILQTAGIAF